MERHFLGQHHILSIHFFTEIVETGYVFDQIENEILIFFLGFLLMSINNQKGLFSYIFLLVTFSSDVMTYFASDLSFPLFKFHVSKSSRNFYYYLLIY